MHTPLPQWAMWSEVAIRVGWAAIAAVIWFVMNRRGHDGGIWAIVGLVLGPFAVVPAVISGMRAARRPPIVVEEGSGVDAAVLVVVDAERPETWAPQAERVIALFGVAELVAVVSRETLDHQAREASLRRARTALAAVAGALAGPSPRQMILEGRPAIVVANRIRQLTGATVLTPPSRYGEELRSSLARTRPGADGLAQATSSISDARG